MHGDEERAVHVAAAQVAGHHVVIPRRVQREQDKLQVGGGELLAHAPQDPGEERVGDAETEDLVPHDHLPEVDDDW